MIARYRYVVELEYMTIRGLLSCYRDGRQGGIKNSVKYVYAIPFTAMKTDLDWPNESTITMALGYLLATILTGTRQFHYCSKKTITDLESKNYQINREYFR